MDGWMVGAVNCKSGCINLYKWRAIFRWLIQTFKSEMLKIARNSESTFCCCCRPALSKLIYPRWMVMKGNCVFVSVLYVGSWPKQQGTIVHRDWHSGSHFFMADLLAGFTS
jgi:hypothetical protein